MRAEGQRIEQKREPSWGSKTEDIAMSSASAIPDQGRSALPQPTFDDVARAAERIEGVAHKTPVQTSRTANGLAGAELFFKCENFQRGGAFKFRGAYNSIAALSDEQRRRGVVTYSSGNHAQALAYASQLQGVEATIIMPNDAPAMKVAATRGYGGQVQFYDRYTENREEIGRRLAAERGLALIPPYDHPDVIAGQGTAAKELLDSIGSLDVLLVPLGGGGLLAGCALTVKHLSPSIKVIGVEPEAGNDGQQSFHKGEIVHIPVPRSIADGAVVTHVGYHNFPIIQALVDDIVTVSDPQLIDAMRFLAERMKMIVEPTGCLGAAAAMNHVYPVKGKRVGVVLSGGNVDLTVFSRLILGR
jgi:threonine dehydratase